MVRRDQDRLAKYEETDMPGGADEARLRAEAKFKKKEEADREAKKIWEERAAAGRAQDENRAKLKSLRLAKEAAEKDAAEKAGAGKDAQAQARPKAAKNSKAAKDSKAAKHSQATKKPPRPK
jgi:hypothetical protein